MENGGLCIDSAHRRRCNGNGSEPEQVGFDSGFAGHMAV
jgi:hypothetical protein